MCKYCELKPGVPGEWTNENQDIECLEDGHTLFVANLNRYVTDGDDGHHIGELILSHQIRLPGGYVEDIQQKFIPIKYCPFCGEKL